MRKKTINRIANLIGIILLTIPYLMIPVPVIAESLAETSITIKLENGEDKSKVIERKVNTVVTATINFKNLNPSKEYEINYYLKNKDNSTSIDIGKQSKQHFRPQSSDGVIEKKISIDASRLLGEGITVRADIRYGDTVLANETNFALEEQSVIFKSDEQTEQSESKEQSESEEQTGQKLFEADQSVSSDIPANYYLINASFEEPQIPGPPPVGGFDFVDEGKVPGWFTTASDKKIEIVRLRGGQHKFKPHTGNQFAEINATQPGELHQMVKTVPGTLMEWSLWHAGRDQEDSMMVNIGTKDNHPCQKIVKSPNREWTQHTGTYKVPKGQTETYFGFKSVSSSGPSMGNYIDDITFKLPEGVDGIKSVDKERADVEDVLTYTIEVWSNGVNKRKVSVKDTLPSEYVSYIPSTTEVDGNPIVDNEAWKGNELNIKSIDLDINQHKKINFKVKINNNAAGTVIKNSAIITDLAKPDNPITTPEVDTNVTGKANMTLAKEVDTTKAKVGDTLTYTITGKNDGKAEWKGIIHDAIQTDLVSYEAGTTTINGKKVEDKEAWKDNALTYKATVKAKDQVVVTFKVKVLEAARNKQIKNIADGGDQDNKDNPKPTPEIVTNIIQDMSNHNHHNKHINHSVESMINKLLLKTGEEKQNILWIIGVMIILSVVLFIYKKNINKD